MLEKVKTYIEKYHMLSPGDNVVAGVSGGADSVCLLLVLLAVQKEIPFTLQVVHVNHLIRPEAAADEAFVRNLCEKYDVPFYPVKKDVAALAAKRGISTEEAGRQVRYAAFREALKRTNPKDLSCCKIAVAHNLNDRGETMLFHLFRGSGLTGLGSIRPVRRESDGVEIIRPLLCVTRSRIEEFLNLKGISWCIDSTNEEDTYTRNRIRHHILPYAEKEIAEGAVANMGRAADILAEADDYIRQETEKAYRECRVSFDEAGTRAFCSAKDTKEVLRTGLLRKPFLTFHPLIQKQLILHCLEELARERKDITHTHVEDILGLFLKEGNRQVQLPYGITVRREYGKVLFEKTTCKSSSSCNAPHGKTGEGSSCLAVKLPQIGGNTLSIPLSYGFTMEFSAFNCEKSVNIPQNQYTKWFDYDKIKKPLAIRTRRQGDYLTFNAAFSKKTIQDYMVGEKIPAGERDGIYLLAEDEHVLWVMGYRISSYYKVSDDTKHILQVQLRGGQ